MIEKRKIIVASRESALAQEQTRLVMAAIAEAHPELDLELITMKTTGDKVLDKSLDKIGGKGLFVKELDDALRECRADIAVHSLKDMPAQTPEDLPLLAFFTRGNPCDALVLPQDAVDLDASKPLGCGSARRVLQLKKLYPRVKTELIRGNVQTRLAKLDAGEYCATVLACAGLERLGLSGRISRAFTPQEMLPAAGQGILAVQGRAGGDYAFLADINDMSAQYAAIAERAFVRELDGGCSSPMAAYAEIHGGKLTLTGLYCDEATGYYTKGSGEGDVREGGEIGAKLAKRLKGEVSVWAGR